MATQYEYGVDEIPPFKHLITLSLQHVMLMFVALAMPVIFAAQINASVEFTSALVAFSMLAAGLGSILQALRLRWLGSGYLCPNVCGPSYFSLSLSAAWMGGMPLMRGMIIMAGLVEMALAPIVQKLKHVFPNYIIGLVVMMVGVSVIVPSVTSLFGLSYRGDAVLGSDAVVGFCALAVMVLCNVWGKGLVRMYCLLIGMLVGWVMALIFLPESRLELVALRDSAWFAWPHMPWGAWEFAFAPKLVLPFLVIGISGSLKSFGNLLAAQKFSRPELKERDFKPIRNGLLADGLSTSLAGLLGGLAVDTSSSNVGLAASTKVLSRWLGMMAGLIFILLALSPKLTTFFSLMPKSVLGASLVFAACFMIITGLQQMFEDPWDVRRTFVVGVAIFLGLSTAFLPGLYARAPYMIQAFFTDPLPTATVLAVVLHQFINLDHTFAKIRKKLS